MHNKKIDKNVNNEKMQKKWLHVQNKGWFQVQITVIDAMTLNILKEDGREMTLEMEESWE